MWLYKGNNFSDTSLPLSNISKWGDLSNCGNKNLNFEKKFENFWKSKQLCLSLYF